MIDRHTLTEAQFSGLAHGLGGPGGVAALRRAQLSKHLLLLKHIHEQWSGDVAVRDGAVEVLARAQSTEPDGFAEVLGNPTVGAWAAVTARRTLEVVDGSVPLAVECGHLAAIAVSAAMRCRIDADLTVYPRGGRIAFPGIGSATSRSPDFSPVRATVRAGALSLGGVPVDAETWNELRLLEATADRHRIVVRLDDLDPYRGGHHAPAADRLTADEVALWRTRFDAAWELLARYAPDRADELTAGLSTMVPLIVGDPRSARSATIRDSFGAFGLTPPGTPVDFAVTLVHEFQHSKLSGLLDVLRLYDRDYQGRFYAPWRTDPRPLGGLMQGVYAFLGVADLWRSLRDCPDLAERAEREYAEVREQLRHALPGLEGSAALTPAGHRFVGGMRETAERMFAEVLPAATVRHAEAALHANREAWSRRNAVDELRR